MPDGPTVDRPDHLSGEIHEDLSGRRRELWARRIGLTLMVALACLALANVFGQDPVTTSAATSEATLSMHAPANLRSGLVDELRITADAHAPIAHPRLVLAEDWFDGFTINTISPEPTGHEYSDRGVILTYAGLPAGDRLVVRISFEADPTTFGSRTWRVALDDGPRRLAAVSRDGFVFP